MLALQIVLATAGAFIAFTGLNVALGGIATLGWLGPTDFYEVSSPSDFLVHDNHVRFLGGVWTAIGGFLIIASADPARFRQGITLAMVLVFAGGIARLSVLDLSVLTGAKLIGSFVAELLGAPAVILWLSKNR